MSLIVNGMDQFGESGVKIGSANYAAKQSQLAAETGETGAFAWGESLSLTGNKSYDDATSVTDILDDALSLDNTNSLDAMIVASNTMSDEAYGQLASEGGSIAEVTPEDAVTILDEIKVTMALAGEDIPGFTDDLSPEAVEALTGSSANAAAITQALQREGLGVTEKNVQDCFAAANTLAELDAPSAGELKYLLENNLNPTVSNLYKASHVGASVAASQSFTYFGTASQGYLGKKGDAADLAGLQSEMDKIIKESGLLVSDESRSQAAFLLEHDLPLTTDTLLRLDTLMQVTSPMTLGEAAGLVASGMKAGVPAMQVDVSVAGSAAVAGINADESGMAGANAAADDTAGYIENAIAMDIATKQISDAALAQAINENQILNIKNLARIQKELSLQAAGMEVTEAGTIVSSDGAIPLAGSTTSVPSASAALAETSAEEAAFTAAKKQLVDVCVQMSAQANLRLLKQGIHIELEPLEKLSQYLQKEEEVFSATKLADMDKAVEEIKNLPARTIGQAVYEQWQAKGEFTLEKVQTTGRDLQSAYEKAGESYEKLMTAPRADLGDSIRTAFRNTEELLAEMDLPATEANQRAVRILGYNQMEITEQHIEEVRAADALLQSVVERMTPDKTMQMIRDDVNPFAMEMEELAEYLDTLDTGVQTTLRYSQYLLKLEQNQEISAEERDAYIGIYRLLRQVEKSDGAALGQVLNNAQTLSMENLLKAVRTNQRGYMDVTVDNAFGLLTELNQKGTSISDQILNYFNREAGNLARDLEAAVDAGKEPLATYDMQQNELEEAGVAPNPAAAPEMMTQEHFESLIASGSPVTLQNVYAQMQLSDQGSLYGDLRKKLAQVGTDSEEAFLRQVRGLSGAMDEGAEATQAAMEELAEANTEILQASIFTEENATANHVDIRSMAMMLGQLSLLSQKSKEEDYYLPLEKGDAISMMHVKMVSGEGQSRVSIELYPTEAAEEGAVATSAEPLQLAFIVREGKVEGFLGMREGKVDSDYANFIENCKASILEKTGMGADINCVSSKTSDVTKLVSGIEKTESVSNPVLYQIAKAVAELEVSL